MLVIFLKKSDYDTKIKDIENKCTTTTEFNKLASDSVNERIVQANIVNKTDFDNKPSDLNRKIVSNKTKDIFLAKKIIFMVKITSMKMVIQIVTYFNQFLDI